MARDGIVRQHRWHSAQSITINSLKPASRNRYSQPLLLNKFTFELTIWKRNDWHTELPFARSRGEQLGGGSLGSVVQLGGGGRRLGHVAAAAPAAAIARVFVRRRGNGRRFPIHGQRRELIAYDGRVSLYHLSIVFALPQTKSSRKPARAQNMRGGSPRRRSRDGATNRSH